MQVAAVGLVLTEILHLRVRTERERYVWPTPGGRSPAPSRAVSDLWIVDDRPKAIEVELSQKSEARYKETWDAYRLRLPHGSALLYLAGWPDGVRCVLDLARRFRVPFIYAASILDFRASYGRVPFAGVRDRETIALEPAQAPMEVR